MENTLTVLAYIALPFVQYYTLLLAYYWYHRLLHHPAAGFLYRAHHIGHHKEKFPIKRLRADEYGDKGGNGWFETGGELVFGIPMLMVVWAMFKVCSLPVALSFAVVVLFVALSGDVCHSSYHLNDNAKCHPEHISIHHWLVSRSFYRKYQLLHDIHHANTTTNFGFADYTMDKLFGTYEESAPSFLLRARTTHADCSKYTDDHSQHTQHEKLEKSNHTNQ